MGRDHLKVSEKREAWKLKVEQILRKTILLTSLHPKHKVTLELGAYGSGRVSTATQNVKMSSIPDYIDSNQYPSSLKGPAKEEAYSFPGKKKKKKKLYICLYCHIKKYFDAYKRADTTTPCQKSK